MIFLGIDDVKEERYSDSRLVISSSAENSYFNRNQLRLLAHCEDLSWRQKKKMQNPPRELLEAIAWRALCVLKKHRQKKSSG